MFNWNSKRKKMKLNKLSALLLLMIALCTVAARAQDKPMDPKEAKRQAKAEQKRQKAELKALKKLKPEQIKALKNGFERTQTDLTICTNQKDSVMRRTSELEMKMTLQDSAVKAMEAQVTKAKADLEEAQNEVAMDKSSGGGAKGGRNGLIPAKGLVYTVQLGSFRDFSLKNMSSSGITMDQQDGMNKYLLGSFRKEAQAEKFKQEIQAMGIKDAWVVAYKDGKRMAK